MAYRLTCRIAAVIAAMTLPLAAARAAPKMPGYRLAATIPLGAPDRWDYVVFDPALQRLYVAHGSEVTVVDAATLQVAGALKGIRGAHGTAPVPSLGIVFADSGKTGTVTEYDAKTLAPHGPIKAVGDAAGMLYDAATKQVVVLGGDSAAAGFIDPATDKLTAVLPLGGSPEGAAVDGHGAMFVEIADRDQIAKIDLHTHTIRARWALPGCHDPHGLAMDTVTQRLFASCPDGHMAVIDAGSGKEMAVLPIGHWTDGAAFDPARRIAFASDGDGTLGMVGEARNGSVTALGTMPTERGARTMALDPATGRLFLVTATVAHVAPPKAPGMRPDVSFVPGTLRLLVYAPAG